MSRRCHHGSPRHLRQAARERRRGPALAERAPIESTDRPSGAPSDDLTERSEAALEPVERLAPDEAPGDLPDISDRVSEEAATEGSPEATPAMATTTPAPTPDPAPAPDPASSEPPGSPAPAPEPVARAVPASPPALRPSARPPRPPEPLRSAAPTVAAPPPIRAPHPREAGPEAEAGPGDAGAERGATAPQLRRFIKSRAYVPMHELRRRFAINGGDDDVVPIDVDRQRVYVGLPAREGSLLGELLRAGDIGYELSLDPIAPIVVGVYPMRPVPRS